FTVLVPSYISSLSLHDALPIFLIILYLGFIPIVIYYFKVPFLQSVLSILLALTFNLTIIHLLAYNLFDMALKISNVPNDPVMIRSEEHTSELQSRFDLVCRLLL